MAKKAGVKTGKTYLSTRSGVNLKAVAVEAAQTQTEYEDTIKLLRATAAQAFLTVGKACAKTGELEAINDAAYWYTQERLRAGISEGTAKKEASQLRQICRACFGGIKVQKKLEENDTLYTHEFVALARKITPAKFLKASSQKAGGREKTKVTDKEFAKMVKWVRLLTVKQRGIIEAIFAKMDASAKTEANKVTPIKAQRKLKIAA